MNECEQCRGSGRMWMLVSPWSDQVKPIECDWCFGAGEIHNDERSAWEKASGTRVHVLRGTS